MNVTEKENKPEELTESQKRQIAFGRKLMASKRELQAEARREYEEDPEIRAIHARLIKKAKDAAK